MAHRVAPEAEVDMLEIWRYIALESSNPETADSFIDAIAEHFLLLTSNPLIGRSRR
jgi:plasmid stabilization system protein ParE